MFEHHKDNKLHWEQGLVYDLSWSSDGGLLTAAGTKGPVRTWRLERGGHKEGEELKALGNDIERLAWCPAAQSSHILAAATYDKVVNMWDQRVGGIATKLSTNGQNSDICWSPSGKYFAIVGKEDGLEIFDMANTQSPVVSADFDDIVYLAKWDANEQLLFLATHQGTVEVYSWPSMEHLTMIPAHAGSCNCVGVDPHGKMLATGGADASMELWKTDDFSMTHVISDHESPLLLTGFSTDGKFIASASDDMDIKIHESFSGDLVHKLPVESLTTALEWHPRNLALAYGSAGSGKGNVKPTVTIFLRS
ncbi:hypothetical protein GGI25_001623 [Coemansia spiralis]|uniref:Anaphase-promoting complex subunit 4 WD40 domain-containing protein n=2 Tax=Coemansia TaxID=4863 RepID=A0A9W8GCB5_9FUNG|nr:WD40-repeat-containing domain protein [Coemansia spiralis]KAJ1991586.1 hypothetical protein EDC05_003351 [Coemansia umbellata]KAJ2623946.1 hypothetical protein GGI26_001961 [Coemansia sp. RSA 1358]KAJ2679267.1 hypothetical protein GGI25_001623 [Coemansia spiralis]